jgi:hypothetical protein
MRCIYCDRSLGILKFRITEPFCSPEHRRLYYRKSDPPLAKLMGTNPQLIDKLTEPAIGEWIPANLPHGERPLSQTLRYPEVASSGPLIKPLRILTDVSPGKRWVRPAPVEFSTVVYVVPPGDEELTSADLRVRILQSSEYTATLRFTLNGSPRTCSARSDWQAGMYGPEVVSLEATCPVSPQLHERLSCGQLPAPLSELRAVRPVEIECPPGSSLADLTALCHRPVPAFSIRQRGVPAPGPRASPGLERLIKPIHSKVDAPLVTQPNTCAPVKLPGIGNPAIGLLASAAVKLNNLNPDSKTDPPMPKLDPIRISANSRLILDSPGKALADSCKPKRSLPLVPKDEPHCFHLVEFREVNPRQARSAAVFAAVFPGLQQPVPLQKTPHDAEHLT